MFAETVTVSGQTYTVFCTPSTPRSEILRLAMLQAKTEEAQQRLEYINEKIDQRTALLARAAKSYAD